MTEISASLVKELRDQTGAGMMDCKRALVETGGDIEAARQLLREKGMAQAAQARRPRDDRGQGRLTASPTTAAGTIVAVGCETEPVSKNDEFLAFAEKVLEAVDAEGARRRERARGASASSSSRKLGENIVVARRRALRGRRRRDARRLRRTRRRTSSACSSSVRGGSRASSRARWRCTSPPSAPQWIGPRRRARRGGRRPSATIYANSDEVQSKPEQAREKIVEGMLNKRFFAQPGACSSTRPGSTTAARRSARRSAEAGAEVLEFERSRVAG